MLAGDWSLILVCRGWCWVPASSIRGGEDHQPHWESTRVTHLLARQTFMDDSSWLLISPPLLYLRVMFCSLWPLPPMFSEPLSPLSPSSHHQVTVFAPAPARPRVRPHLPAPHFISFSGNKSQTWEQKFSGLLRSGKLKLQISYKTKFSDRKL